MEKKKSKLIDKVISGLDWDSILEVNKCFKIGVGEGVSAIPGIKRKPFSEGISKSDLKSELKALLKHVIENDLAELYYNTWMIYWNNAEWIVEGMELTDEEDHDEESGVKVTFSVDSTLEVVYSPQRIFIIDNESKETSTNDDSDANRLEAMLKKALDTEKYELASKIRDIIRLQNGESSGDK